MDKRSQETITESIFDREFRLLVKCCLDIIRARYSLTASIAGNIIPEEFCTKRYLTLYNNMKPEEHFQYIESLFNRNRDSIINTIKDDTWLREGQVTIQFGEGIKEMVSRCKDVKIPISRIYNIAYALKEEAAKRFEGIDPEFTSSSNDLIMPYRLQLHLIRLFYIVNKTGDKRVLLDIVSHLEDLLKTGDRIGQDLPMDPVPSTDTAPGISGLFNLATKMMEQMGYPKPAGMKPPTNEEFNHVINTVICNEQTQSVIGDMLESLQSLKGSDPNSAIQAIISKVADPKTMEAIQSSVVNGIQSQTQNQTSFGTQTGSVETGTVGSIASTP